MRAYILLVLSLAASPLIAQVETLPPRALGPLAPRPVDPTPLVVVDPYAERGPTLLPTNTANEGFFFDSTMALVFPTLRKHNSADIFFRVPQTDLDTTFATSWEIGYRLPDTQGLFAVNYSLLNAEGTAPYTLGTIDGSVKTRASLNVLDIDYGSPAYEFAPRYTVSWRLGGRIAGLYFDSRSVNGPLTQQASNNFFGSGGHGRVEVERRITLVPGLSLFGRVDGAFLVGCSQQRFREDFAGSTLEMTDRDGRTVPVLNLQAGLNYLPPSLPGLKITAGYTYEEWFKAGSLGLSAGGAIPTSQGGLMWHGPFLRAQYDF